MSPVPLAWLVTWSTYGWWLPGDPRGFQTRRGKQYVPPPARYAKRGEPIYDPAQYKELFKQMKQVVPSAVVLTRDEQCIALAAAVAEIELLSLKPYVIAQATTHAHLVAEFGLLWIRPTVGRFKSRATRDMPNPGNRKRVWAEQCHMTSLPDDRALQAAIDYVEGHEDEGALVFRWYTR